MSSIHPTDQKNKQKGEGRAYSRFLESDIKKFQALYATHFGLALDKYEARSELTQLVRQIEIIYQPVSVSQLDRLLVMGSRG